MDQELHPPRKICRGGESKRRISRRLHDNLRRQTGSGPVAVRKHSAVTAKCGRHGKQLFPDRARNQCGPASYIHRFLPWVQHGFKADALIHFGTHGSLEYTPKKQAALCDNDWPDRLVGALPHFYIYTIGNVGEAMIAKRRSYAGTQSYLTPPFMESSLRSTYRQLMRSEE